MGRALRAFLILALPGLALSGRPLAGAEGPAMAGVAWQPPVTVATGDADMGPWRMNRSRFHYVDDPTVALLQDGRAGVAWVDNRAQNVYFALLGPGDDAPLVGPTDVSASPGTFSWLPRVVLTEAGEVFVLWQEIVFSGGSHGGEAFFARSDDGGRTFSAPVNLSGSEAGDGKGRLTRERWHNGSLDLARAPDGTLVAAWTEYEGTLWVSRSTDGGRSFSLPLRVAGSEAEPARGPDLALGADGAAYLAWTVGEDPGADLRLAASTDGGASFGAPRVLFPGPGHADAPKIALDGGGRLHLAYALGDDGPFGAHHVRYARLDPDAPGDAEPRRLGSGPGGGSAHFPHLALGGDGAVVVVWELYPDPERRPYGLGVAVSGDGGATFVEPAVLPGTADPSLGFNGSLQGFLMDKLDVNARGDVAVVNSRFLPRERSLVRVIRGEVGGDAR